ncbi:MAG: hypothetical protein WBW41_13360 [Verrucomicrobiia bacterium]
MRKKSSNLKLGAPGAVKNAPDEVWHTAARHSSKIPYGLDPDFHAHPIPAPLSCPGQELSPQEREIVRRLCTPQRLQFFPQIAAAERALPKGVKLTVEQQDLLRSIAGGPTSEVRQQRIHALWSLDYQTPPPTIDQFVDDDYYLGSSLHRTLTNEGLWPWWREWLVQNASLGSFLHNLVISGAIGSGKTLVMVTLILYRIAVCATLRDPYAFYGLSRGSPLHFLVLSLSKDTLRSTAWRTALQLMERSPFFQELLSSDRGRPQANLEMILRVNAGTQGEFRITFAGGSKQQHQIGRNVLCVGLDEGNFRLEQDPDMYAFDLFRDLRARMLSRIRRIGAFMPGLSIVVSSAAGESCFTEELIRQIDNDGDANGQHVVRPALYRIKPGLKLCPWSFKVAYGLPNVEPTILCGCYSDSGQPITPSGDCPPEIAGPHESVPAGAGVELVPGDYYDEFAHSPRKHLQQLSGISLGGSNRLFPTLADIERCLENSTEEGVLVPSAATIISISDENQRQIWDDLDLKTFVRAAGRDTFEPIRHPSRRRYAHLDLAISGLAGLAICHLADRVRSGPAPTPVETQSARLVVEYDFILTLTGGKTRPICYDKIFQFFLWLRKSCGYVFGLVTADSFQSEHLLQSLYAEGIATECRSVDRDKKAYLAWRAAFQENSIRLYRQQQLLKEAAALVELDTKIDHPSNGTKDTTDAAAGAFLNAISSEEIKTLKVPEGPSALVGISGFLENTIEDPFGFLRRLPPRRTQVFEA